MHGARRCPRMPGRFSMLRRELVHAGCTGSHQGRRALRRVAARPAATPFQEPAGGSVALAAAAARSSTPSNISGWFAAPHCGGRGAGWRGSQGKRSSGWGDGSGGGDSLLSAATSTPSQSSTRLCHGVTDGAEGASMSTELQSPFQKWCAAQEKSRDSGKFRGCDSGLAGPGAAHGGRLGELGANVRETGAAASACFPGEGRQNPPQREKTAARAYGNTACPPTAPARPLFQSGTAGRYRYEPTRSTR